MATLEIEKLVYGGAGLARHEGKVWLVPLTVPGDIVEAEEVSDRGNRVEGALIRVIRPSPERRQPVCSLYSECGGCQLQHMTYGEQCRVKLGFVRESLEREGVDAGIVGEFIPSPYEFGYRTRVQLGVKDGRVGFLKRHTNHLVELDSCPLLLQPLNNAIAPLREYARGSGSQAFGNGQAYAITGENGAVAAEPPPDRSWPREVRWTTGGVTFWCAPDVMFQANAHMLDAFQSVVCEGARGEFLIDLFGGTGFFSLPMAGRFKEVLVIEESRPAVALGKRNAKEAGLGNVRFVASRIEDIDPDTLEVSPDLMLVDPPRAGLSNKAFRLVSGVSPRAVIYVSCDPVSLARDVKKLVQTGYALQRLVVLDMFPQTYHVETVAFLADARGKTC